MNASAPRVSAIVPCFNRAKYIRQCVDSILAQTYENIQVVVVDDGSSDGCYDILQSYGDRVTLLTHPGRENRGQSASINLGINESSGKYVAILDSDDWWAPEKIEAQVRHMESHPDVGLVYANGFQVTESGERMWRFYGPDHVEESDPGRVLADCYFLVPNNSLVRRDVLDRIGGFDETLRAAQDHDVAIRISEATRLAYIPEDLFFYRRHDDSISAKSPKTRWTNGFKILEKASKRYDYSSRELRCRRAVLHFRIAQLYLAERQLVKGLWHLLCAGANDPGRAGRVALGREKVSSPSA